MANFKKGPQVVVINSADRYKMLFYATQVDPNVSGVEGFNLIEAGDVMTLAANKATLVSEAAGFNPDADGVLADQDGGGAGTAIALADITLVKIPTYVDLKKGLIKTVTGAKGIAGQKHKITSTITGGTFTVGNEVTFVVTMKSTRKIADLASWKSDYQIERIYSVVIDSSITTLTLLAAALAEKINARGKMGGGIEGLLDLTAVASGATIAIEAPELGIELSAVTSDPAKVFASTDAQTVAFFEGRNTAKQLIEGNISSVNDSRLFPYSDQIADLPIEGKLYSLYRLAFDVSRPDLGGGDSLNAAQAGEFTFDLYINEDLTTYISALVAWLNAAGVVTGAKLMYTGASYANRNVTDTTLT